MTTNLAAGCTSAITSGTRMSPLPTAHTVDALASKVIFWRRLARARVALISYVASAKTPRYLREKEAR